MQCKARNTEDDICVPKVLQCDGAFHCKDGEDEENCPDSGEFQCNDGKGHVPHSQECDGKEDCEDGSDEMMNCGKKSKSLILSKQILSSCFILADYLLQCE